MHGWSCRSEAGRQWTSLCALRRRGNLLRVGLDSSTARECIRGRPLRVRKSESLTGDGVGSHHHRQWYGQQSSPVERACRHHPCLPNDCKLNHPPGAPRLPCRRSTGRARPASLRTESALTCQINGRSPHLSLHVTKTPCTLFRHSLSDPSRQTVFTTSVLRTSFFFSTPSVIYWLAPWPSKAETAAPVNREPIALTLLAKRARPQSSPDASGLSTL